MHTDHEWALACYEAADWLTWQNDSEYTEATAADFQSWLDRSALNRHAYLEVVEAQKRVMEMCRRAAQHEIVAPG